MPLWLAIGLRGRRAQDKASRPPRCGRANDTDIAKMWVKDAGFNLLRACIGFGIHGLVRTSATSRQSCEHFCPCYRTLTRLFKLIATAQWQGCGNRAATARREFRGVKWNPAGPLPGRVVRGRKHHCTPVAARPFLTASAFYDRRCRGGRRPGRCRSASRTGDAPRTLRHADGRELAGRRLSRRRHQARRHE
jgi:hypothetical protein